jgi:predicted small lipoprotein YifL
MLINQLILIFIGIVKEKNKMKKELSVVIALVMVFTLTACGVNKNGTNDISQQEQQSTTPRESAPAETEVAGSQAETVDNIDTEEASKMKISLAIGDTVFTATMIDNETTRDFVSLLPLTLQMNDLFSREKYAHLPRAISEGEEGRKPMK